MGTTRERMENPLYIIIDLTKLCVSSSCTKSPWIELHIMNYHCAFNIIHMCPLLGFIMLYSQAVKMISRVIWDNCPNGGCGVMNPNKVKGWCLYQESLKVNLMYVLCNYHIIIHKRKAGTCTKSPLGEFCDCLTMFWLF